MKKEKKLKKLKIETICRQQNYVAKITSLSKLEQHCGKRRKSWSSAFSSFHTKNPTVLKQDDCDGPVLLHWQIHKIPTCQTIGFECNTPETGLKLVVLVLMVSNKRISKDFTL